MTRADRFALILSVVAVLAAYLVADHVFERMAHIEDEMAYVWQAQVIAAEKLMLPSPPQPNSFLVPFVVDYNGERFGKYPLGWPVMLAIGVRLGLRDWINPLLAGLGVWLTYRLGKRAFGETVGLLAAGLTVISPFFLINSGSLLSHPFGLVLSAAFALAWLDAFGEIPSPRPWLATVTAGLTLGLLALTRPLTAVAVGFPFALHGLYLLVRGSGETRKRVLAVGALALLIGSLVLLWQYAVTGNPRLNPYTLWWDYDKIGFGPGVGRITGGHSLNQALINTRASLYQGDFDLFGWLQYSWIFIPFGAIVAIRNLITRKLPVHSLLLASVFPSLVVFYLAYWVGAQLYGPRYYYEGLYSLTIFSGAGIAFLAGWPTQPGEPWHSYSGWQRWRTLGITAVMGVLVAITLWFAIPARVGGMYGLYDIKRSSLAPFQTQEALKMAPALVIVHPQEWTLYGAFLELENPFLNTPFIFVFDRGPELNAEVAGAFPDRHVYHYYPDQPWVFYSGPRP